MPLTPIVVPGHTFANNTPFDADDLNAAAKPAVQLDGLIGSSDIDGGAIVPAKVTPGAYFYAADTTGATNGYVANPSPALGALDNGVVIYFKVRAGTTNTSASTLNVSGLGAVNILRSGGAALHPGDIRESRICQVQYCSTGYWELINPINPDVRQCPTSAGTAAAYTVTTAPTVTALYTGCRVSFHCHVDCDATPTLAVDGLTAKQIRRHDDTALAALELQQNAVIDVIYDAAANSSAGAWIAVGGVSDLSTPSGALTAFYTQRVNSGATATEWVKPPILQMSVTKAALESSNADLIPYDDTIPQSTEGTEYVTKAFTPLSTTSHVLVEFDVYAEVNGANSVCVVALFKDADAGALATTASNLTDGLGVNFHVAYDYVPGATDEITFKIRYGPDGGGETMTMGAVAAGLNYGDTMFYVLKITEYLA
jgi:hypothetical protein